MPFWDTSALVKLYVRERDSDDFVELARKSETRATISQLSIHEMRCVSQGVRAGDPTEHNRARLS